MVISFIDASKLSEIVWIALQLVLIYLDNSWAIGNGNSSELDTATIQMVTETSSDNQITSFRRLTTVTPDAVNSMFQIPSIANSSSTDTIEHGGILGTAAAYKLDIREPLIGCSLSEFSCSNGRCVPISKYCDRVNDCDDNSDEPRFCTRESTIE